MRNSAFLIAFFATIVRYYDYALFGLSAAILAKNFIAPSTNDQQILGFFAIFSFVAIVRPVGSIIFGIIGDKYGRAVSVKISVIWATLSTGFIGITPSFDQIGILATIILILCRIIFIMSLAGESDSIKIYVAENIGNVHKNLANGIVAFCSQIGALLAATIYHYSIKSEYTEYLWRINFIIGGIFGLLIIIMRHSFQESEEFLYYKASYNKSDNLNLWQIIKNTRIRFIIALLINGCVGGVYHFLVIFLGTFAATIVCIITPHQAQIMNIVLIMIYGMMSVFSGFLADKIDPKKQIMTSLILSLVILIIMQYFITKQIFFLCFSAVITGIVPFYVVPLQIIIQSIFTINIRMRMYSLSHSCGGMIFSSSTPFFCMLLWKYSHSLSLILAFLIILLVILFSAVIYLYYRILLKSSVL